jgi:hypothetical protein
MQVTSIAKFIKPEATRIFQVVLYLTQMEVGNLPALSDLLQLEVENFPVVSDLTQMEIDLVGLTQRAV